MNLMGPYNLNYDIIISIIMMKINKIYCPRKVWFLKQVKYT